MPVASLNFPVKKIRKVLPNDIDLSSWEQIKPVFDDLVARNFTNVNDLTRWMVDVSEVSSIISEYAGWLYIKMSCDTGNKKLSESFDNFYEQVDPHLKSYYNNFNKKIINSPFCSELGNDFKILLRSLKQHIDIYRESNIPLFTRLQIDEQKYGNITSKQLVSFEGKDLTLQQAAVYLKDSDRTKRENIFLKIAAERNKNVAELNDLLSGLIENRNSVAINAGFKNYRDYQFAALNRFDYTKEDCFQFHDVVAAVVTPTVKQLDTNRKTTLELESLRPWDTEVDVGMRPPVKPFVDTSDLMEKSIKCFYNIHPYFGECLEIMKELKHLDLDSRKGKAPGGFNYPLYETGVPFIYMNSAGLVRDLVTMMHEGGHAVHSFLCNRHEIDDFKSCPSETAELASMSMELISMEHWDVFFEDKNDLIRAKRDHLEKIIKMFSSIMCVDKFQHWLYENPNHRAEERAIKWTEITNLYNTGVVDWSGLEEFKKNGWQSYLHIFEVPFYYIEYAMAQLGAIAVWKNYRKNPSETIERYMNALQLGGTRSIPEVYAAAGVKFDFSKEYVSDLISFLKQELDTLS